MKAQVQWGLGGTPHFVLMSLLCHPRQMTLETSDYNAALASGTIMGTTNESYVCNFKSKLYISYI